MSNVPPDYSAPPMAQQSGSNMKIVIIILSVLGALALVFCAGLVILLIPAIGAARQAAMIAQDSQRLQQVGLAMLNYESAHKSFPAPTTINSKNEPVWAWRIALLPYVDEITHYQDIAKVTYPEMHPWDHSDYQQVFQRPSPEVFQSMRANLPSDSMESNVFVITAPERTEVNPLFVQGEYVKIRSIIDGTSNTIAAIQFTKYSEPWAKPNTLTADEAYELLAQEDRICLVLMVDGTVRQLSTEISRAEFDALVTRDGGELSITTY